MGFHEVLQDFMGFNDVSVNQSMPTEANRGLISYSGFLLFLLLILVAFSSLALQFFFLISVASFCAFFASSAYCFLYNLAASASSFVCVLWSLSASVRG
jgi:hypothetical protein